MKKIALFFIFVFVMAPYVKAESTCGVYENTIIDEEYVPALVEKYVSAKDSWFSQNGYKFVSDMTVNLSWPELHHVPVFGWLFKGINECFLDLYEVFFWVEKDDRFYTVNSYLQIFDEDSLLSTKPIKEDQVGVRLYAFEDMETTYKPTITINAKILDNAMYNTYRIFTVSFD